MNRVLVAEWIKLRSLRSTWYTLAGLFVISLGITLLSSNTAQRAYADDVGAWDPTAYSLTTFKVAQLIVGVLAIMVVTSEFATGLIRTTLTATPRRHRVLAAKVVIAVAVAAVAGQVLMFAAFLIGQSLLAGNGVPNAGLGDPGVLRAVFAGGLYLALIAVLAVGLATIIRTTAGAIVALVGIVILVPALAGAFPSWMSHLFVVWPTLGGAAALRTVPDPGFPHPWWNLAGMCLAILVVLAAAFVVLRRRDV
ncbi:ABC transporter permease [Actinoplanes sp. NBRC 103695]|uniref:ABC transporter permease n=1 Tax=Actinoplanes sp. NBRC 103695 TaxID=3032202 RepID=UPI00249FFA83|nr:ABC transporter permease [Actinoplanes sp. NBRC 103695]GLZ01112.1 ABC transporter permease [Actinoplanes sp. NBRC 103695]